jgi:hypothetical protein
MRAAGFAGGIGPRGKKRTFPRTWSPGHPSNFSSPAAFYKKWEILAPSASLGELNDSRAAPWDRWKFCVLRAGRYGGIRFDLKR